MANTKRKDALQTRKSLRVCFRRFVKHGLRLLKTKRKSHKESHEGVASALHEPKDPTGFNFLPAEIRNHIYRNCFSSAYQILPASRTQVSSPESRTVIWPQNNGFMARAFDINYPNPCTLDCVIGLDINLLQTSRSLRHEALEILFSETKFQFHLGQLGYSPPLVEQPWFELIQCVEIYTDISAYSLRNLWSIIVNTAERSLSPETCLPYETLVHLFSSSKSPRRSFRVTLANSHGLCLPVAQEPFIHALKSLTGFGKLSVQIHHPSSRFSVLDHRSRAGPADIGAYVVRAREASIMTFETDSVLRIALGPSEVIEEPYSCCLEYFPRTYLETVSREIKDGIADQGSMTDEPSGHL